MQDPEEGSSESSSSSGESPVLGARARSPVKKEFFVKQEIKEEVKEEVKEELETPRRRFLHTVSGSSISSLALYEWLMEDPNPPPNPPPEEEVPPPEEENVDEELQVDEDVVGEAVTLGQLKDILKEFRETLGVRSRRNSRANVNDVGSATKREDHWRGVAAKLGSYTKDTDDFALWSTNFEKLSASEGWDEATRMGVLLVKLKGPAERILRRIEYCGWDSSQTLAACKSRLIPSRSYKQIAHELLHMEVKISDEPEGLMRRIEDVIKTADMNVNKQSLVQLQATTFMNKINVHVPLWNYVLDEAKDLNNPEDLVNTANAYYRAKGSETLFFMNILDQRIKENAAGTLKPINEMSFFPGVQPSAARTKDASNVPKKEEAVVAAMVKSDDDDDEDEVAECHARFLKPGEKISAEEWRKRANEVEGFMRDVRKAGLLGSKGGAVKAAVKPSVGSGSEGGREKKWKKMEPNPRVRAKEEGKRVRSNWKPKYKGKELDTSNKANMQQWSMQTQVLLPEGVRPDDPDLEWKDPELFEKDE